MQRKEALLLGLRIILEGISYYNARYLTLFTQISPSLLIYITHSFFSIFLVYEVLKHKSNLIKVIKKRTGIQFGHFLCSIGVLTLIHNLKSLVRLFCFIKINDCTIMSLSCTNILFTKYLFSRIIMNDKERMFVLFIALCSLYVMINDKNIFSTIGISISAFFSSLYNVLYKRLVFRNEALNEKINEMLENKRHLIKNKEKKKIIDFYGKELNKAQDELSNNSVINVRPFKHENKSILYEKSRNINLGETEPIVTKLEVIEEIRQNLNHKSLTLCQEKDSNSTIFYKTYYFSIFSSLFTLLFYWPTILSDRTFEFTFRGIFHSLMFLMLSQILSFYHFLLIGLVTPLFAQISSMFFKISVLIINILLNGLGSSSFVSFIIIFSVFFVDKI